MFTVISVGSFVCTKESCKHSIFLCLEKYHCFPFSVKLSASDIENHSTINKLITLMSIKLIRHKFCINGAER